MSGDRERLEGTPDDAPEPRPDDRESGPGERDGDGKSPVKHFVTVALSAEMAQDFGLMDAVFLESLGEDNCE